MPRQTNAGERIAALETELPHVWEHAQETRNEMREAITGLNLRLSSIEKTLSKYAQTGLLLATAGLVHSVSSGSSAFAAELLKVAFSVFTK